MSVHDNTVLHCRYGYPALVALNPQKLAFATLRSAFEPGPVADFVGRLRQVSLRACLRRNPGNIHRAPTRSQQSSSDCYFSFSTTSRNIARALFVAISLCVAQ